MINSTSNKKDIPWLYLISSTSLVMSITTLLFRWREETMINFSEKFPNEQFQRNLSISYFTMFNSMYIYIMLKALINTSKALININPYAVSG